jgi:hypothetical protein
VTDDTTLLENTAGEGTMIDDENVPLAANDETANEVTPTTINDQATPLAGQVCQECCQCTKGDKMYWWWVLAIIGSITGKVAWDQKNLYDEQKSEEKARKERNRNNNYRNHRGDDLEDF